MQMNKLRWESHGRPQGATLLYDALWDSQRNFVHLHYHVLLTREMLVGRDKSVLTKKAKQ